jgi:hypothetical protein
MALCLMLVLIQKVKHINGVKGIWAFDILPYASLIMKTKDRMHTSQHVVEDSLRVLIPSKGYHLCQLLYDILCNLS